jgi:glycosyltransferase involved in cell wall biosynthesis
MKLLEFLIPTYKRPDSVVDAAVSIAQQILQEHLEDAVAIRIVDDGSPGFSKNAISNALLEYSSCIVIEVNKYNKGMSRNIYDMVKSSRSKFCTVLTDDDLLFPGALSRIVSHLTKLADDLRIGGLFTPRYSYQESGELYCVVCNPFKRDTLLDPGPVASIKYCHNGFILTGFIFRPQFMASDDWILNIDNSFFPVINFAAILSFSSILYVNENWFRHIVLNVCHWEDWGASSTQQRHRLYLDYMDAIGFISNRSWQDANSLSSRLGVARYEIINYLRQIKDYLLSKDANIFRVSSLVRAKLSYWFATFLAPCLLVYSLGRIIMIRLLRVFASFVGIPWTRFLLR